MTERRLKDRMRQNRRKAKKRLRRKLIFAGLIAVFVLLIVLCVYLGLRSYVNRIPEDQILDNVFIGTVEVSGMSREEAKTAVESHYQEHLGYTAVLRVQDESAEATMEELGLKAVDLDGLVEEALDYGRSGSVWSRFKKIRGLKKEKAVIEENFSLDEETAKAVLNERVAPLAAGAQNAYIERSADGFQAVDEKEGYSIDIDASIANIETYINGKWDHDNFEVEMVLVKQEPEIRAADLESIEDELGTFSTNAGGGDRWQNLSTGASKLNGTILMPGESLSVYEKTAPYDEEHGYVAAGSYENGQVVDSYGGGICQVSTTLYNAVLNAELQVDKRYPHSMLVSYVKPSRDAAIAEGVLDFVFTNSYDTPIYIAGEIDDANELRFTIYGKDTRPEGRTVEYISETLETEEYGIVYKEDPEADLGSMKYEGSPHTGVKAQLWKVVYQDGVEESREVINHSTYAKSDQVIKVGTASDDPAKTKLVQDAIATQDQAKINAAISQAQSL